MQVRIESPDAIWTDKELRCRGLDIFRLHGISRLVIAAVYDDEGAEARGGVCERGIGLGGGKQGGGEEHGESGDGGGPTVPETGRENHGRSAAAGWGDGKGEPSSGSAGKGVKL